MKRVVFFCKEIIIDNDYTQKYNYISTMYTIVVPKPDDCIHKRSHSHLSEKRQISKRHAISYKNKIVPEIIYLINMYICICILYPMPKLLIYMYRYIKRIYMEF